MASSHTQTVPAVLTFPPSPHPVFRYTEVNVRTKLRPGELLIRMVATGLCHTDIYIASLPADTGAVMYPTVLGHEGSGYVEAVGDGVTVASPGDSVLLSYNCCKKCVLCNTGRPTYCEKFNELNIAGETDIFTTSDSGSEPVQGKFFGQSSFSSLSVVQEASIVNVKDLIQSREELKLLSPLGCGLQTGAGAVMNSGKPDSSDILLVIGLGGVGLGAVMAGKVSGCREIIAVDRVTSRLEIAKEVGATRVLDTTGIAKEDLVAAIQKTVDNERISLAIDTTGLPFLTNAAIGALGKRGKFIQIGIPTDMMGKLEVSWMDLWNKMLIIECNIEGNAVAKDFVPRMIGWWREGKFPVEKLVKYFEAKDVENALKAIEDGSVIKPVLVW